MFEAASLRMGISDYAVAGKIEEWGWGGPTLIGLETQLLSVCLVVTQTRNPRAGATEQLFKIPLRKPVTKDHTPYDSIYIKCLEQAKL